MTNTTLCVKVNDAGIYDVCLTKIGGISACTRILFGDVDLNFKRSYIIVIVTIFYTDQFCDDTI